MTFLPDAILKLMSPTDRAKLGKAGITQSEATAKFEAKRESEMHSIFSQWLNLHEIPFVHSRNDKRTSQAPGVPDFIVFGDSRCVLIEMKMPGKKLQPVQVDFAAKCEAKGVVVHVCTMAADAIELTKKLLKVKQP